MKCYSPLSSCSGAFSIMGDNVGEGGSFSCMMQEKSLSTATKWSLRLRPFCQLLCPRLQNGLRPSSASDGTFNSSRMTKVKVSIQDRPHCLCWESRCRVLSAAPRVVSALVFRSCMQKRRSGWGGFLLLLLLLLPLLWPRISIPSAHSAKPAPLLWDHPLASRRSRMLNMASCHLVSSLPPPFFLQPLYKHKSLSLLLSRPRLLWRLERSLDGKDEGKMTTIRMRCFSF